MSVVDEAAYANAIASFVKAVECEVVLARERDAALEVIERVRVLCDEWETYRDLDTTVEDVLAEIRAALEMPNEPDRRGHLQAVEPSQAPEQPPPPSAPSDSYRPFSPTKSGDTT